MEIIIRPDGSILLPICCKCLSAGAAPCPDHAVHQQALRMAGELMDEGLVEGYLEAVEVQ